MDPDASLDRYRKAVQAHPELAADVSPPQSDETAPAVPDSDAGGDESGFGRFSPNYEIVGPIAETRLSRTWKAWNRERKANVVIKEPRADLLIDPKAEERFRREVQLASRLMHPNIVPILDTHLAEPPWFYTMPLIEGRHLDVYCKEQRLSIARRLALFHKVCDAVTHAHQQGVIHRDLKPNNILVSEEGEPQLLDFGLGRLLEADGVPSVATGDRLLGSPGYMAPEQAQCLPVDTRTDVYALGVILYELLTERLPIDPASDLDETLRRIYEDAPVPPRRRNPRLSRELNAIVLKALAKKPADRYQSARELVQDIDNHLNVRPVDALRHTSGYVFGKWLRRNKSSVVLGAGAAIAVVVLHVFAVMNYYSGQRRETERHIKAVLMGRLQTVRDNPVNAAAQLWSEYLQYDTTRTRFALWELYRRYPCVLSVDAGPQRDVEYSPGGRWLACVGEDQRLSLFDAETGDCVQVLYADAARARCVKFSPTRAELYVGGSDGRLHIWSFSEESGRAGDYPTQTLRITRGEVTALAVSPGGNWMVACGEEPLTGADPDSADSTICLWDVCNDFAATQTWPLPGERVHALTFANDERTLAGAGWRPLASSRAPRGDSVFIWDVRSEEGPRRVGGGGPVNRAVVFSADGRRVFTGGNCLQCVELPSETETLLVNDCKWGIRSIAATNAPAGPYLAFATGDGRIRFYDELRGSLLPEEGFHAVVADLIDVCFSPDGSRLASVSSDGLRVWRFPPAFAARIPGIADSGGLHLTISGSGERVAISRAGGSETQPVFIWQRSAEESLLKRTELLNAGAHPKFSEDGRWLALTRMEEDRRQLVIVEASTPNDVIASVTVELDGWPEMFWLDSESRTLLLACSDSTLRLWPAGAPPAQGGTGVSPVVLLSDLEVIHRFDSGCTCFATDQRRQWLAASSEGPDGHGRVALWRATGRKLGEGSFADAFEFETEFATHAYTWNVALLTDGDRKLTIATSGSSRRVSLWDPLTGRQVGSLAGHRDAVFHCRSLDGNVLVTASRDNTVRVWDVEQREEVCVLYESRYMQPEIAVSNGRIAIADGSVVMVADAREIERFLTGNRVYESRLLSRE